MSWRFISGSAVGFILVVLLYAKLADLAEGATSPAPSTTTAQGQETSTVNQPEESKPDATALPEPDPVASSWYPWLVGGSVVLLLGGVGFLGVEVRKSLLQRDKYEKDPPLLEDLFRAYADLISQLLFTPRQIKRFSSKVRLQHNLMHHMSRQKFKGRASGEFSFSEEAQILSFLYLLLIERDRETNQVLVRSTSAEFSDHLRSQAVKEFSSLLILSDEVIRNGSKAAAMLQHHQDGHLIDQLCRLNRGALV